MVPELITGAAVTDHLKMTVPYMGWDFKATSFVRNGSVILETKKGVQLRGGIYPSKMPDGSSVILFVGSPRVHTIQELEVNKGPACLPQPKQAFSLSFQFRLCA